MTAFTADDWVLLRELASYVVGVALMAWIAWATWRYRGTGDD